MVVDTSPACAEVPSVDRRLQAFSREWIRTAEMSHHALSNPCRRPLRNRLSLTVAAEEVAHRRHLACGGAPWPPRPSSPGSIPTRTRHLNPTISRPSSPLSGCLTRSLATPSTQPLSLRKAVIDPRLTDFSPRHGMGIAPKARRKPRFRSTALRNATELPSKTACGALQRLSVSLKNDARSSAKASRVI